MLTRMLIFGDKATPMLRAATLVCLFIAVQGTAMAEDAKDDAKENTVQVHGKSLALSCTEWKRNQDGSWTNVSPLLVGTDTVNSVTLRGTKDTSAWKRNAPTDRAQPPSHRKTTMQRDIRGIGITLRSLPTERRGAGTGRDRN